jgi:hypothetical protein
VSVAVAVVVVLGQCQQSSEECGTPERGCSRRHSAYRPRPPGSVVVAAVVAAAAAAMAAVCSAFSVVAAGDAAGLYALHAESALLDNKLWHRYRPQRLDSLKKVSILR